MYTSYYDKVYELPGSLLKNFGGTNLYCLRFDDVTMG